MVNFSSLIPRVMPCLLLDEGVFVKTEKFKKPVYIGDPINTINLFNKFEVDEIIVLDIGCPRKNRSPNFSLIQDLATECWVPLSYGGGIQSVSDVRKILNSGIEKVIIDRLCFVNPDEVRKCVREFGASSVVASLNIKRALFGNYQIRTNYGRKKLKFSIKGVLAYIQALGVGEIIINDISRDGTRAGFDLNLINMITNHSTVPVVAVGGAGKIEDFKMAIDAGASAVGAGSYFVFQNHLTSSVLVNFPDRIKLERLFHEK